MFWWWKMPSMEVSWTSFGSTNPPSPNFDPSLFKSAKRWVTCIVTISCIEIWNWKIFSLLKRSLKFKLNWLILVLPTPQTTTLKFSAMLSKGPKKLIWLPKFINFISNPNKSMIHWRLTFLLWVSYFSPWSWLGSHSSMPRQMTPTTNFYLNKKSRTSGNSIWAVSWPLKMKKVQWCRISRTCLWAWWT